MWYWRRHAGLFLLIDCCSFWLNVLSWRRRQSQIPTATSPASNIPISKLLICACQFHLHKPILFNISDKIQKLVIETKKIQKSSFLSWCEASNMKSTLTFGLHKNFKERAKTLMQIHAWYMWYVKYLHGLRFKNLVTYKCLGKFESWDKPGLFFFVNWTLGQVGEENRQGFLTIELGLFFSFFFGCKADKTS